MKILYLSSRSPLPLGSGEKLKTYYQLRAFSENGYQVTYVCFYRNASELKDLESLHGIVSEVHPIRWSRFRQFLHMVWFFLCGYPLQVGWFYSLQFAKTVDNLAPQHDLVFCNLVRTAQYARRLRMPKFIDLCDSLARHYKLALKAPSNLAWRLIYFLESSRMEKFEQKCIEEFDTSFCYNPAEFEHHIDSQNKARKLRRVVQGVREGLLARQVPQKIAFPHRICFLGKMNYQPNIDAVTWFAARVFAKLPAPYEFYILGSDPSPEVLALERSVPRIKVTGFLDDPYSIMQNSLCTVGPLRFGGGIQNKILESMAVGCPVLVSQLVAEPILQISRQSSLVVCRSEADYLAQIEKLSGDPGNSYDLRLKLREETKAHFTWKLHFESYRVWLEQAVPPRHPLVTGSEAPHPASP